MTPEEFHHIWLASAHRDFRGAVAQSVFKQLLEERWAAYTKELKEAGYTTLWVGTNPFWKNSDRADCLVACPPQRDPWPSIWSITRKYFKTSCGNELDGADNVFLYSPLPQEYRRQHCLSESTG